MLNQQDVLPSGVRAFYLGTSTTPGEQVLSSALPNLTASALHRESMPAFPGALLPAKSANRALLSVLYDACVLMHHVSCMYTHLPRSVHVARCSCRVRVRAELLSVESAWIGVALLAVTKSGFVDISSTRNPGQAGASRPAWPATEPGWAEKKKRKRSMRRCPKHPRVFRAEHTKHHHKRLSLHAQCAL